MQPSFFQSVSGLLQQFQQSNPPQNPPLPPQVASVNALQQQLLQSIQSMDQNNLHQASLNALLQSLQQQTPQAPSTSISSTQLLSDALKMIAPVGQSPNDEQLLVMALHSGLSQGFDHKRAIETLHGVNNHAANLWKDYYLEHKPRIDEMVDRLQPTKTAKKPVRFDLQPRASSASPELGEKQAMKGRLANASYPPTPAESGSSRGILVPRASDGLPTPRMRGRSSSRHSDLPIPPPPGAEPIPPTKVVKGKRGNRYTVEDKKYFAKYISWALQLEPSLTKSDLIARLAEKVPHHTVGSWYAHWSRDPLADRLLAAAKDKTSDHQEFVGDTEEEDKDKEWEWEEASPYDSDEDEVAMGPSGGGFTAADFRIMAKYIARHGSDEWAQMTGKQRWFPFHEEHPQRSDKSWGERYRAVELELLASAEQYRRRAQRQLEQQCGTPSWAIDAGRKRRLSVHESPGKRVRK